jgi:large subunit ribosomal protein L13
MKNSAPKPRDIERRWYVVDANGVVLGRLASEVAQILRGKHKPIFAPHADTGDHVIVVNARGVRLTGAKLEQKEMHRHSGYPGGLRSVSYARLLEQRPSLVVEKAIKGMLPKNRLGRAIFRKLQVYEGPEHPHAAQKPVALAVGTIPAWGGLPEPTPPPAPKPKEEPKATRTSRKATARTAASGRSGPKTAARSGARPAARSSAKSTGRSTAKRTTAAKGEGGTRTRRTTRTKKES